MENPDAPPPRPAGPPDFSDAEQRNWAMIAHLSTLVALVGVPLGNLLGPLIVWLIKKDQMPLVDDQAKEALNFQISLTIYTVVAVVLALVLIGFVLLVALLVFDLVFTIIAATQASQGQRYRYPLTIRLIN